MKIIKRLKELLKAGTQEPWEMLAGEHQVTIRVGTAYVGAPYQKPHGRGACPVQLADGCLMVEGRNALPALLAVVEAQAAEIENAREFRRRCCEYTLSFLDPKGERIADMERRLIAGYSKLKENTDAARRDLESIG